MFAPVLTSKEHPTSVILVRGLPLLVPLVLLYLAVAGRWWRTFGPTPLRVTVQHPLLLRRPKVFDPGADQTEPQSGRNKALSLF